MYQNGISLLKINSTLKREMPQSSKLHDRNYRKTKPYSENRKYCKTENIAKQKILQKRKYCKTENSAEQKIVQNRKYRKTENI